MARLTRIYLALGSNLGDRLEFFQRTLDSIKSIAKLERVAPIYETEPWGITDQPRFLNTVAEAKTHLEPIELLMMIKTIEKTLGRKSTLRNGPRVIDMDILLYGSQQVSLPELEIPHPRLLERVFALAPLADLAPDLRPPGWKLSVRGQLESLDRSGVSLFPAALLNLKVLPAGATGGSAMVNLPAEVGLALGKTGSAPVRCRINNIEFRTTISPTGIGTHTMVLNQQLRREAGFKAGDDVLLRLELDSEPRVVEIPADVQAALQAYPAAEARFARLSFSHKKEYMDYIESAKAPETRARRIAQLLAKLNKNE
jgi:2-amino-4-hydroxy-6-hydroxymethyldihydropteridine diphosphokinase